MRVYLNHLKRMSFTAQARDFTGIRIDEPESFHGDDLGPSPVEYFLIGIGGCLGSTYVYCLNLNKITFEKLDIILDGKLSHSGPKMYLKLIKIDVEFIITLKEGQSIEKINSCEKKYKDHCPITDIFLNGIPLNIKFSRNY